MKITVFTSNQPRHLALINSLSKISDEVFAIQECNTVFTGKVEGAFKKSDVMERYFSNVLQSEKNLFGGLSFLPHKVRSLSIKSGDLNHLQRFQLEDALQSDYYIIFSASWIKGWLIDFLVEHNAVNLHLGISPYYRGSSCNFWALYDNRPEYVGATIHMLSKGLDSGPILYHALPEFNNLEPFDFTMTSVEAAQKSVIERISSKELLHYEPVEQDKTKQIRYTRKVEFTDDIASDFLSRGMTSENIKQLLSNNEKPELFHPFYA